MKRILLQFLVATFLIATPVQNVYAAQKSLPATICDFFKDVYTFEYLNGKKGEYRDASLIQKILRQPGRAIITAAVYGTSFLVLKTLYDIADQHGLFNEMRNAAERAKFEHGLGEYQERQREKFRQNPVRYRPDNEFPAPEGNRFALATPIAGRQLRVMNLPNLNGFYHMESNMPHQFQFNEDGERIDGPCGIYSAYNIARLDCMIRGQQLRNEDFDRALRDAIPDLRMIDRQGGASDLDVSNILAGLGIAPLIILGFNQNGDIQRIGREVWIQALGNHQEQQMAFDQALVDAAEQDTVQAVRLFRNAAGPACAHFLCAIPGHWIAISVVKNAQGEQAMYLYDNLNEQPHAINQMRRHIENIYHRFFNPREV